MPRESCDVAPNASDIAPSPIPVDAQVFPLGPTQRMQTLPKGRGAGLALWIILRIVHQHCDPAHPLALLRARRERPRRHAAEKLNELAPPHRLASSNWAPSDYHTVARQDAAVRPEESAYANCFQALAKVPAPEGRLLALTQAYQQSQDFLALRERTRADYIKQITKIEQRFGDAPIKALAD